MKHRIIVGLILVFIISVAIYGAMGIRSTQAQRQWELHEFNTKQEALEYLNRLPPEIADSAKVFAIPSERNIAGWLGKPYQVFSRKSGP
jgi:hypothetical protein